MRVDQSLCGTTQLGAKHARVSAPRLCDKMSTARLLLRCANHHDLFGALACIDEAAGFQKCTS